MKSRSCQRALTIRAAVASIATVGLAAAMLLGSSGPTRADEPLKLIAKIDVGGKGLGAFDISFVDPELNLYVVSDQTNASVDFIDTTFNHFIGRVGGFKGVVLNSNGTPNNSLSGPDGVVVIQHRTVWAGDGDSTVKVIDLRTGKIVDTISTGGQFRADEMSWDAQDHILTAANNADTPPFLTMIDTDSHKVLGRISFDGSNGTPNATNGLEQSQWSPETGMFYVSVPQIGPVVANGGVAVIDPRSMSVVAVYTVQQCTPAGLTLGPHLHALLGCSASFGTSPNVLTQSVVMDLRTGNTIANIPQVGGSDEVWYDAGSRHYYLAARSNTDNTGKITPILGAIDARTNRFDGSATTSTTAHSVAADRFLGRVYLPIGFVPPTAPPGTDPTNPCPTHGCIAVYRALGDDDDDAWQREAGR